MTTIFSLFDLKFMKVNLGGDADFGAGLGGDAEFGAEVTFFLPKFTSSENNYIFSFSFLQLQNLFQR